MTGTKSDHQEYLIVGAGPAGLQLAYFLQKRGCRYLVLEAGSAPGTFFATYPRHRKLISINKVHTGVTRTETNLRWDWNSLLCDTDKLLMREYTHDYFPDAGTLRRYLRDFARHYALNVQYDTSVTRVSKPNGRFVLETAGGAAFTADRLVVATGLAKFHVPDIPGVEHAERYPTVSINRDEFRGQRVLVVGKGNSGLETADALSETAAVIHMLSPHPVRMAWRTHYVGDLRAVNNNMLDTYQLKSQNTILDATIDRIEKLADGRKQVDFTYSHADGQRWTIIVDRVILCTGFMFDAAIFDPETAAPQLTANGKYPELTAEWESVSVPGLYFAGTLMHGCDYRKAFSGFIHGFRYNVECLDRLMRRKYHGEPLAAGILSASPAAIARAIVDRVNTTSSLFQQPGFLADAFVIGAGGQAAHYRDLPIALLHQDLEFRGRPMLLLTLEYGHLAEHDDPFNVHRRPLRGAESRFIHPVLRYEIDLTPRAKYHVPEDLENEWDKPMYVEPLTVFLDEVLARPASAATASLVELS